MIFAFVLCIPDAKACHERSFRFVGPSLCRFDGAFAIEPATRSRVAGKYCRHGQHLSGCTRSLCECREPGQACSFRG
ncbi:protein of unknown function [Thauera humireducens]|nr:protein of unknown function [Thauera humireducens]